MYSRLLFRSIQNPAPSLLILNRCLSLTPIQSNAATKLKETSSSNDISSSSAKVSEEKATTSNASDLNRTYSDQIHRIVGEISKLSLVEVMDLNELLKVS